MPSCPTPSSHRISSGILILAMALALCLCLLAPQMADAHQMLSADPPQAAPSPSPTSNDDDLIAEDNVALVLGYAAAVAIGLGGLALLDRRPPVETHDDPDDHRFDDPDNIA